MLWQKALNLFVVMLMVFQPVGVPVMYVIAQDEPTVEKSDSSKEEISDDEKSKDDSEEKEEAKGSDEEEIANPKEEQEDENAAKEDPAKDEDAGTSEEPSGEVVEENSPQNDGQEQEILQDETIENPIENLEESLGGTVEEIGQAIQETGDSLQDAVGNVQSAGDDAIGQIPVEPEPENGIWTTDEGKKKAKTIENVELGREYKFPGNEEVVVKFTKLPENPGTLSIEEIVFSQEQMAQFGALSEKAYDITSSMENGTFEYELSLPLSGKQKTKLAYIEKTAEEIDNSNSEDVEFVDSVKVGTENIEAKNIDHFTIFYAFESTEGGQIETAVLSEVKAETVDLAGIDPANVEQTAQLATDKADYFPTDTAIIAGTGFVAGRTYVLTVSSSDEPPISTDVEVMADENGEFVYAYQLDGNYRPDYKVVVKDAITQEVVATITFTDDAADPILGSTTGNYVINPDGTITLTLRGAWKWPTHKTDCNLDRYATGWAIDWNDANQPGNIVGTVGGVTVDVGTKTANALNPADNNVHYYFETTPPAGSGVTTRCGTYGPQTDPVGNYNTGLWGEISHIYPAGTTSFNACVVTYDMHFKDKNHPELGAKESDLIAGGTGHAGDNSVQSNSSTPLGNGCFSAKIQTLLVQKVVVGGSAQPSDFNIHVDAVTPDVNDFSGSSAGTNVHVGVGSYAVTENAGGPANYSVSYSPGCAGSIAAGETKVCTVTNTYVGQPNLIAVKTNDAPGGSVLIDNPFNWNIRVSNPVGAATANFSSGSVILTDNLPTGATYGSASVTSSGIIGTINCSIASNVLTCTAGTAVSIPAAALFDVKFSTIPSQEGLLVNPNTDNQGKCQVDPDKLVAESNENDNDCADTVTVIGNPHLTLIKEVENGENGVAEPDDFKLTINGNPALSGQTNVLVPGEYAIDETQLSGYEFVSITGSKCPIALGGKVTLAVGDDIFCTIKNKAIAPTLTVIKNVVNDNGGNATVNDFNIILDDQDPLVFDGGTKNGYVTTYTAHPIVGVLRDNELIEDTNVPGYTAGTWNCSDNDTQQSITMPFYLSSGQDVTCTITNDDQPGTLIVKKIVKNDNGGTKVAGDFSFSVNGAGAVNFESDGQNDLSVSAGTYSLTESSANGYATTYDNCADLVIPNGGTQTCTITNDDIQPKLTVIKHLIANDGSQDTAASFTMSVSGSNSSPASFAGDENGTQVAIDAGSYEVTENGPSGYDSDFSADCKGSINIGETKTCTVTNDDQAPKLTLVKTVINDNGGTKQVSDFPLFINGNPVTSGNAVTLRSNVEYMASETSQFGYAASAWGGDCSADGKIILKPGENKTCTITNNDIQPKLTVTKIVNNGAYGKLGISDFPLFVDQTRVYSGIQNGFNAGSYVISETQNSGYAPEITGDCDKNGNVTLGVGEEKSCTITNTDNFGKIIIEKQTLPDGDGEYFNFSGEISGSIKDGQKLEKIVVPGQYAVFENVPAGWDLTNISCDDGNSAVSAAAGNAADIKVEANETVKCVFTNTKRGQIKIIKDAINNDAQDFVFNDNFGNGNPATFSLDDDSNGTLPNSRIFEVLPGKYAVSENAVAGWQQESVTCDKEETVDDIDVEPGEIVTCTFVNEEYATIKLVKITIGGDETFDFTMTGTGLPSSIQLTTVAGKASQLFADLDQDNTYSISENKPLLGWANTGGSCSNGDPINSITPNPGENITCTFTNEKLAIDVQKTANPTKIPEPGGSVNFTVRVDNTSSVAVELTSLSDDIFGNLNGKGTCSLGHVIAAGGYYQCSFSESISGNAGDIHHDTVTAVASGASDSDDATVDFTDVMPSIEVTKTAGVDKISEPGGDVTYTFTVKNTSPTESVTITSLADDKFGTLTGGADCQLTTVLAAGATCTFDSTQTISGNAGDIHTNVFTAIAEDDEKNKASDDDDASVEFTFLPTSLKIDKFVSTTEQYSLLDQKPGDTVKYIIVVKAPELCTVNSLSVETEQLENTCNASNIDDVVVTDLPPEGFDYAGNPSIASSNTEHAGELDLYHEYASPGIWHLGTMVPGEIITLSYDVVISQQQEAGTYNDIAWAAGTNAVGEQVVATKGDPAYFVGTQVAVIVPAKNDVKIKNSVITEIERKTKTKTKKKYVTSAALPATGTPSFWLLLAAAMIIAGVSTLILRKKSMKKRVIIAGSIMAISLGTIFAGGAKASTNLIAVQVQQPDAMISSDTYPIGFVALGMDPTKKITVKCFRLPGDVQFGGDITLQNTNGSGNSGNCILDTTVLSANDGGSYQFYIEASDGDVTETSEPTDPVKIDIIGPETPLKYERPSSSCVASFTTADDGQTEKVEMYRSTSSTFVADSSTYVGEVSIAPNTDGTITDPNLDCGSGYYYAIRAVDADGNGSGFVGDKNVTVNTETRTRTRTRTRTISVPGPAAGAIPVAGGAAGEGAVAGEQTGEQQQQGQEGEGSVLGEQTKGEGSSGTFGIFGKYWPWLLIILGIATAWYYGAFRKKKKENEEVQ